MIPVTLYDNQLNLVNRVREEFRTYNDVMMQSPTGSGKSRMAAWVTASALSKGGRVIFDVPMKELRKQISNTLGEFEISHSFIAGGCTYNPMAQCYVSTSPTLDGRIDRVAPANLLIVDEAHQGGAGRGRIIDWHKSNGGKVLRLSASPERLDGKPIGCDTMVMGDTIRWLIEHKRLSDYRLFNASKPDLSALRVSGGDYRQSDVSGFMESQSVLIGDAVGHYQRIAMGKRNVAYCVSIKHSQLVCQAFRDAGIPAAHIDGTMTDAGRAQIIRAYARRELLVLTNADLLLYGFDLAASSGDKNAVIECISDLKPTMSRAMQTQKNGRALRVKPDGSAAIIFDHASNAFNPDGSVKHGMPDDEYEWNWRGKERKSRQGEASIPVRICPTCFMAHRPAPYCPYCGHKFETEGRTVEEVEGELVEVTREQAQQIAKQERRNQGQADTFEALLELEHRKGNKRGWAESVWISRQAKKGVTVTRQELARARSQWRG